ncbi:MAG: ATP-dependent 6-phosphofructokinase [Candidatus Zixiibacteriota bacterium]|nr:MAG: ATP-dependent 6-phosphofructokinase [candidate division Zixibacteria bacterium]
MSKTIAILTGGGDAPGLNAVIRAAVKTAVLHYGDRVLGIPDGYDGLVKGIASQPLDVASVAGLLYRGGTILGTSNRGDPFHYPVEEGGIIVKKDLSGVLLARLKELAADALIVIGGDGSLTIARDLHSLGAPIVGVPKTIDNDISATDVTFGFNTAIATATDALDKLHTTAESHHRVMVLEVMGRDTGWIALHSGLAGGADVILIPEIPFAYEAMCDRIIWRRSHGRKFSIIVVAEGAHPAGGTPVVQETAAQTHGLARLGGIGYSVGEEIRGRLGLEVRVTVLGHIQRGGTPCVYDRLLATRLGCEAVHLVHQEEFGHMVALRGNRIIAVPLAMAVGRPKKVDPQDQLVRTAEVTGICMGR